MSKIYRILLAILDKALARLKLAPCRVSTTLKEVLSKLPDRVFWIDGTETPIQRNIGHDAQEEDLSGKQHAHRLKNLTLCVASQHIHFLSSTEPGSMHDKALADLDPLVLPTHPISTQTGSGFLGSCPSRCHH